MTNAAYVVPALLASLVSLGSLAGCASPRPPSVSAPAKAAPHAPDYVVGGHVVGLRGIGLSLRSDRGEVVPIDDDGKFVFTRPVEDGAAFTITVASEPASPLQSCVIAKGVGRVAGGSAMDATVTCTTLSLEVEEAPTVLAESR